MKIIKFGAVWCPGCLIMKNVWDKVKKEIPNLVITEYDYDLDEDKQIEYNVGDKLPVVIMIDDNNKEIKRIVGEKSKQEILDFIKEN